MTTRRDWITQTSVGAVGAALGLRVLSDAPTARAETVRASSARTPVTVEGPAPWALLSPLQAGSSIGLGWSIVELSEVRAGASVLSLRHQSGATSSVHICLRQGAPTGVAASQHFDFVLMNESRGTSATDEALGVCVMGLARRAETNEAQLSQRGFMRHSDRLEQYGWDRLT